MFIDKTGKDYWVYLSQDDLTYLVSNVTFVGSEVKNCPLEETVDKEHIKFGSVDITSIPDSQNGVFYERKHNNSLILIHFPHLESLQNKSTDLINAMYNGKNRIYVSRMTK